MITPLGKQFTLWLSPSAWTNKRSTGSAKSGPIRLPGNGFTVWIKAAPASAAPAAPSKLIRLPGRQFTIWTKPENAGLRAKTPATWTAPAQSSAKQAAQSEPSSGGGSSIARIAAIAAVLLLIGFVVKQQIDLRRVRKDREHDNSEKREAIKQRDEAEKKFVKSSEKATSLAALLADLETKSQVVSKERDGAKQTLTLREDALKRAETAAKTAGDDLAAATKELTTLKKESGEKETAYNNSVAALKEEAAKLKRSLEQKEVEAKSALVKLEGEKATAVKDAAAAAGQLREMTTARDKAVAELEAAKKELAEAKAKTNAAAPQ